MSQMFEVSPDRWIRLSLIREVEIVQLRDEFSVGILMPHSGGISKDFPTLKEAQNFQNRLLKEIENDLSIKAPH